ncbi:18086_t:CDS:2, partial [Racocetra persica]
SLDTPLDVLFGNRKIQFVKDVDDNRILLSAIQSALKLLYNRKQQIEKNEESDKKKDAGKDEKEIAKKDEK